MWTYVFSYLGPILRNGISGSYGNSVFNFVRIYQSVFQRACTVLHSHQQSVVFHISPTIIIVSLLHIPILAGVKWYFIMVLICISLRANDIEYLFVSVYISSLEKCLCKSFVQFLIGFLSLYCWVVHIMFLKLKCFRFPLEGEIPPVKPRL